MMSLRSERLRFRPVSLDDLPFLEQSQTDPKIMKHIGDGQIRNPEQIRENLNRYLDLRARNPLLGQWIILEVSSGRAVGSLILRPPATAGETRGLEIGFTFIPESWGKGYATESAMAILDYSKHYFPGDRIIALVMESNPASRRVLEKAGLHLIGKTIYVNPVNSEQMECLLMAKEP